MAKTMTVTVAINPYDDELTSVVLTDVTDVRSEEGAVWIEVDGAIALIVSLRKLISVEIDRGEAQA